MLRDITDQDALYAHLKQSERHFRGIFDSSPVALFEEDFSAVRDYFDTLRARGVEDLSEHFDLHPQEIVRIAGMVKIESVNPATLKLYEAETPGEFHAGLKGIFNDASLEVFRQGLIALWQGKQHFEAEAHTVTLKGHSFHGLVQWAVPPQWDKSSARLLVSVHDLSGRKALEDLLAANEQHFRALFEDSPIALWQEDDSLLFAHFAVLRAKGVVDLEAHLIQYPDEFSQCMSRVVVKRANRRALELFEVSDVDQFQMRVPEFLTEKGVAAFRVGLDKLYKGELKVEKEFALLSANKRPMELLVRLVVDKASQPMGSRVLVSLIDITDRKQVEHSMSEALGQKEALMGEIHHRVKNNLMVIQSLLRLQASQINDQRARELFLESQNRIQSMSMIHERLYKTGDFKMVLASEYVRDLVGMVANSYSTSVNFPRISFDLEPIFLEVDTLIPMGLILTELASNSLKYGRDEMGKCSLHVTLKRNGATCSMTVKDSGPGLPEGIEQQGMSFMGVFIIKTLVTQLKGNLTFSNINGAEVTITFPVQ